MSSALIVVTQEQVTNPSAIAELQRNFKGYDVHQQLLERILENAIQLPANKYSRIHISGGALTADVADRLYLSMKENGIISGVTASENKGPLVLAGFVCSDSDTWTKKGSAQSVSAPLQRRNGVSSKKKATTSAFRRAPAPEPITPPGNDEDPDDIINEDDLVDDRLSSSAFKFPARCDPGPGKKRRRACKDCTCGLKEAEETEDQTRQDNLLRLNAADLAEVDFTVPGKAVGGCGSCALGDAFRCDGCPYLGLPPFKPGEVVSIDQFGDDL